MNAPTDLESSFQQARALLASAYRQLNVIVLQADVPLDETRYFTSHGSNLALLRQYHPVISALLFLLTDAEHGGQPFADLIPLLPDSLAQGELRRIFWYEQPIAISLHPDPLPHALLFTQRLGAILAWSSQREHPYPGLIVSEEARQHMSLRDPLPLAALTASLPSAEGSESHEQKGGLH